MRIVAYGQRGFDRSGLDLKLPVASERNGTGQIRTGLDIRPGHLYQHVYRHLAGIPLGKITAVDQNIGLFGKCRLDRGHVLSILGRHRFRRERARA